MNHLRSHEESNSPIMDSCPFCTLVFESESYQAYKHIGYHLEEIRLLSLPDCEPESPSNDERGGNSTGETSPLEGSTAWWNRLMSRETMDMQIAAWLSDDGTEYSHTSKLVPYLPTVIELLILFTVQKLILF